MSTAAEQISPLRFHAARRGDGAALWRLVKDAGTLELNSAYFYLIFAEHFGATCLIAEQDDEAVGGVVAYRLSQRPDTVFVWQIGVAAPLRGRGLGLRLLQELLALPGCDGVRYLEASVTLDNIASQKLFRALAREHGAPCEQREFFSADMFPVPHQAEVLFRVGPLREEQD